MPVARTGRGRQAAASLFAIAFLTKEYKFVHSIRCSTTIQWGWPTNYDILSPKNSSCYWQAQDEHKPYICGLQYRGITQSCIIISNMLTFRLKSAQKDHASTIVPVSTYYTLLIILLYYNSDWVCWDHFDCQNGLAPSLTLRYGLHGLAVKIGSRRTDSGGQNQSL